MVVKGLMTFLALASVAAATDPAFVAVVHLVPHDITKYNVSGELRLTQEIDNGPIVISGTVYGLSPGLHGFHVHQAGDLSNGCTSALSHFNPDGHTHGAPEDNIRHVGDLGNIEASADGIANVHITDGLISFSGRNNILARSIVVHAKPDDLGKGRHNLSLSTGNAGDRAACGIIGILSSVDSSSNSGSNGLSSSLTILLTSGMLTIFVHQY